MIRAVSRRTVPLGFTRDGRFFYGESRKATDVYTIRLEPGTGKVIGSPAKLIDQYEGFNRLPRYSHDGKHLAYCSQRGNRRSGGSVLCIRALETGKEQDFPSEFRRLGIDTVARPQWSADDQSIVVSGYQNQVNGGIYRINIQSGNVTPIVQEGEDFRVGLAIWNDAKVLLYQRHDKKNNRVQFVTRNTESGSEKIIYTFSESENPLFPELSHDGRWLCYLSNKVFYLMNPAGGEPRPIFEITGQGQLPNRYTWAADSRHILFTRKEEGVGWQLWRLPVDGGQPEALGLALQSNIAFLHAHRDGQRVAISYGPLGGAEIWVMENFLPKNDPVKKQHEP